MFHLAPLTFSSIPGEEDDDGVQVRTGQTPDPIIRMIAAGVAKNFRAGHHALFEFLRERGE